MFNIYFFILVIQTSDYQSSQTIECSFLPQSFFLGFVQKKSQTKLFL